MARPLRPRSSPRSSFWGVDPDTDVVSGMAAPNSWVMVDANPSDQEGASRWVQADGDGSWSADFGVPGASDWEQNVLDILPGFDGSAFQEDEDWDGTWDNWHVPNPDFRADRQATRSGAGSGHQVPTSL